MKKSVGIITVYDLDNYGNRLQNYAVQKIITNMGFSAKTYNHVRYDKKIDRKLFINANIHKFTNYKFSSDPNFWKIKFGRLLSFKSFTNKYLPTQLIKTFNNLCNNEDYFVLGSDQVWNATWFDKDWFGKEQKDLYLLTFAKPPQRDTFHSKINIFLKMMDYLIHF